MQNKVLMILCDGMRPDAVTECKHPFAEKLMSTAHYNPHAQTVFPSWTLRVTFLFLQAELRMSTGFSVTPMFPVKEKDFLSSFATTENPLRFSTVGANSKTFINPIPFATEDLFRKNISPTEK